MKTLQDLIFDFEQIDRMILESELTSSAVLVAKKYVHTLYRNALRLKLSYQDDAFYKSTRAHNDQVRIDQMIEALKTAMSLLDSRVSSDQYENVRRLSTISTICLPLSIITGFFGMNFAFMGIDPKSSGILRMKGAPWILLGTIALSVTGTLISIGKI